MELPTELPTKSPNSSAMYSIKTLGLSYRIPRRIDELNRFFCREVEMDECVLKNVSCEVRAGKMTAIAGPSGAGKTTLLDILAGKVPLSRVSGSVLVNDFLMNEKKFRRISGYVTQEEALFPLLTVEETLMYSARLRLIGGREKAKARVRELLTELGLDHAAHQRIGDESNRGISGGEKRRVSIGVDLVHDPVVLMLDEPTSGLDSASALHIASLLKSMAIRQGKTIVLTIHQPGFRILELFDQILMLAKGTLVHSGTMELLEQRLRVSGHSIPRHVNVVEFAIEVADGLLADTNQNGTENGIEQRVCRRITMNANFVSVEGGETFFPNSFMQEVYILSERFSIIILRTKQLFLSRTLQAVLAGFVLGSIFTNSNVSNHVNLQSQIGFFAFNLTFLVSSSAEGLAIYLQQRRILMRETSRGAYRVSSYVISDTLIFLPFLLIVCLLYTIPVYWLVGLNRDIEGFLYFSLLAWMVVLMSNSVIACCSALVPDFMMGTSIVSAFFGACFLFSGYFISKGDIPRYWIFMHYLSLFKYPLECLMINEYGGKRGKRLCLASEDGICFLHGDTFLMQRGLQQWEKWSHLGVILSFIVGYRFICFLILSYRSLRAKN